MYIQIEVTAFLQLKSIIENAKKGYKLILKIIFKNLRLQFLKRKSERSNVTNTHLHIGNPVRASYPLGTSNMINSFPEDTQNQNDSILQECLNRMPAIQRNAFVYKTFEDKRTSSICTDLDINEAVFWKLIQNARKELIESLDLA